MIPTELDIDGRMAALEAAYAALEPDLQAEDPVVRAQAMKRRKALFWQMGVVEDAILAELSRTRVAERQRQEREAQEAKTEQARQQGLQTWEKMRAQRQAQQAAQEDHDGQRDEE